MPNPTIQISLGMRPPVLSRRHVLAHNWAHGASYHLLRAHWPSAAPLAYIGSMPVAAVQDSKLNLAVQPAVQLQRSARDKSLQRYACNSGHEARLAARRHRDANASAGTPPHNLQTQQAPSASPSSCSGLRGGPGYPQPAPAPLGRMGSSCWLTCRWQTCPPAAQRGP